MSESYEQLYLSLPDFIPSLYKVLYNIQHDITCESHMDLKSVHKWIIDEEEDINNLTRISSE